MKKYNTFNEKELGLWYFIFANISHCNVISYNCNGISSITFSDKELSRLIKLSSGNLYNKLKKYSNFIKTIEINNINIIENYQKIIKHVDENTLVYIDSPYDNKNSKKLYFSDFNKIDQINLNKFVGKLSENNILFIQSNSNTIFINNLFCKFNIYIYSIRDRIRKGEKYRKELIITNFNI